MNLDDTEEKEIKSILMPLKLTGTSINALKMARTLARCCSARLEILSVVNSAAEPDASTDDTGATDMESAKTRIQDLYREPLKRVENLNVICRRGDPAREIVAHAAACEADLIVLGCHFRDDRPCYNRLGEVAQIIFQRAPCAVMLVPCQKSE